ncbi:DUF2182 domain-containing protein [Microbacteriaceae bacterium VKM Ac-2854]|nr:DUF2182 domain-containing protein [Microbacteriaceae bacterium VKM Ac-2854]
MSLRRALRVHPEWPAALVAAAAWPLLLAGPASHGALPVATHAHGATPTADVLVGLPHWSLMCVAMMVPIALPAVRHVGRNSLRRRRGRAMAEFLLGYLTVWLVFGAVALSLAGTIRSALAAVVVIAVLWPFTPWHRRMRGGCHRTVPLPASGMGATRADIRFGLQHGAYCVGSCAPAMLAMAVLMHTGALAMLAVTAMLAAARLVPARYLRPPRRLATRWRSAWRSAREPSPPPRRDPSAARWSPDLRADAG